MLESDWLMSILRFTGLFIGVKVFILRTCGISFIVSSLRHTCVIIMPSNQTPVRRMDYLGSLTQICEQYLREIGLLCLRSLSPAHEKCGKN